MRDFFVYIITNPRKSVLYVGVTNNLEQRLIEHYLNRGQKKTFAGRYHCYNLLYFERYQSPSKAIEREKEIKLFRRSLKIELINGENPDWRFMNSKIMDWPPGAEACPR